MRRPNKKGFTIVELVIVIAVVAILAAVLIPTFVNVVNKANVSNDTALVRNINTTLATEEVGAEKPKTMHDAMKMAERGGFDVSKLTPRSSGEIVWDSATNRFALVNGDETVYSDGDVKIAKNASVWKIVKTADEAKNNTVYSNYLAGNGITGKVEVSTGLDVGENSNITAVNYTSTQKQNIVIRTNSAVTVLTVVDKFNGTIDHYDKLGKLILTECGYDCYHENGTTAYAKVAKGRIIANNGGYIEVAYAETAEVAFTENGGKINAYCKDNADGIKSFSDSKGGNVEFNIAADVEEKGEEAVKNANSMVMVSGIAGFEGVEFANIQIAFERIKAVLENASGLSEEAMNETQFNSFFTEGGKITWAIYGTQKVTDTRMFSFGRAANRFGEDRHITEIDIIGANSFSELDLTEVNGTFALPYNWWNVEESVNTALVCKNITFSGIKSMPSATFQCTLHNTRYAFDGCTFNGDLYSYQNFDVDMTIKNCIFNAPANTQYAFMSQGAGGKITLDNNVFNNYTRGVNLQRATADFVFANNKINSNCSESDRGAIQLTDGKSFVVTGNTVNINAGNAFWFHNAATNADVTYTISNNDINAPYIGYSGVTAFDVNTKITSSGNRFNSTDTTKCMKKGATVAESTNLTAIK